MSLYHRDTQANAVATSCWSRRALLRAAAACAAPFAVPRASGAAPLPRSDATAAGWSGTKLDEARRRAEAAGSTAVTIVWRDRVIAEWGPCEQPILCHSVRKSLLSALYGIAVADGRIDIHATMAQLGIDDIGGLTPEERQARVIDLLEARSGVYHLAAAETLAMRQRRPARGSHPPGTFWYYNNWDFNVLGTIYRQRTGADIFAAFKERIADPIGMEHFRVDRCAYHFERNVSIHPAYLFRMSARDLARFGLLYLHRGRWEGRQVVPETWVAQSTGSYSQAEGGVGYGYLWWVAIDGMHFRQRVGIGTFSARGVGGNVLVVAPAHDLVIAHRVDDEGTRREVTSVQLGTILGAILEAMPA